MSDDIHERIADWDLDRRIRLAISDPGAFLPRGGDYTEAIPSWSGRAVMTVMQRELAERDAEIERLRADNATWLEERTTWKERAQQAETAIELARTVLDDMPEGLARDVLLKALGQPGGS